MFAILLTPSCRRCRPFRFSDGFNLDAEHLRKFVLLFLLDGLLSSFGSLDCSIGCFL